MNLKEFNRLYPVGTEVLYLDKYEGIIFNEGSLIYWDISSWAKLTEAHLNRYPLLKEYIGTPYQTKNNHNIDKQDITYLDEELTIGGE